MRTITVACLVLVASGIPTARAAMLCARLKADGTFSTGVKVREACKHREVRLSIFQLDPVVVFQHASTTTSTTGPSTTSTSGFPTTTTRPDFGPCGSAVCTNCGSCGLTGFSGRCAYRVSDNTVACADLANASVTTCDSDADCIATQFCMDSFGACSGVTRRCYGICPSNR
jgi:hypothetical protein